jgi:hypothetical protein
VKAAAGRGRKEKGKRRKEMTGKRRKEMTSSAVAP